MHILCSDTLSRRMCINLLYSLIDPIPHTAFAIWIYNNLLIW